MKNSIYLLLLLCIVMVSCQDFLDVNDDPTRISDEKVVPIDVLLPTACLGTSTAYYACGSQAMNITHHLDNIQSGYYQLFSNNSTWEQVYLRVLPTTNLITEKAAELNAPHYAGVAKILEAVSVGLLADNWEAAPFSEANLDLENLSPAFDSQDDLYQTILNLLDEGLSLIAEEESELSPGSDDMFYGGDLAAWERLAHSLKARYMLHVLNKGVSDAGSILSEVSQGFTSNADNFGIQYTSMNANPWYSGISRLFNQAIYTRAFGTHFTQIMTGEADSVADPRIGYVIALDEDATEYDGLSSWITEDSWTALPTDSMYGMGVDSKPLIMSYAELKFIEAELKLETGGAEQAYNDAIRAHMEMVGLSITDDSTAISDYLADPIVADVSLQNVMKEKYIATLYNFEAWNDMRRHGFSEDVYPNYLTEPDFPGYDGTGIPAYRAEYPSSEINRNESSVKPHRKDLTEKMWKDQ